MYDTPSDQHTGLSHDLPANIGNQDANVLDWLWDLLGWR